MIRNFIRTKRAEFKIKAMLFGAIANVIDGHKDYINALVKLLDFAKGYAGDDFQSDFMTALASVIHNDVSGEGNE